MSSLQIKNLNNNKTFTTSLNDIDKGYGVPPIISGVCGASYNITNLKLINGHKYRFEVLFRGHTSNASTPTKCSSVGFLVSWNGGSFHYVSSSKTAFERLNRATRVSYDFTYTGTDITPSTTQIKLEIDVGGNDSQNIDIYYYSYQDMSSSSKITKGVNFKILDVFNTNNSKKYYKFLSSDLNVAENPNAYFFDESSLDNNKKLFSVSKSTIKTQVATSAYGGSKLGSSSSMTVWAGNYYYWIASNVGQLNISLNMNTTTNISKGANFYCGVEEYKEGLKKMVKLVPEYHSFDIPVITRYYIFLNSTPKGYFDSNVGGSVSLTVAPGDIVYIKAVFRDGGGIYLGRTVYGEEYSMKKPNWTMTEKKKQEMAAQLQNKYVLPTQVKVSIMTGDTTYGMLTASGDSNIGGAMGTTGYRLLDNIITTTFINPSSYDDFLSKLRSRN